MEIYYQDVQNALGHPKYRDEIAAALLGCAFNNTVDLKTSFEIVRVNTTDRHIIIVDRSGAELPITHSDGVILASEALHSAVLAYQNAERLSLATASKYERDPHRDEIESVSAHASVLRKEKRFGEALDVLDRLCHQPMADAIKARVLNQHAACMLDLINRYDLGLMARLDSDLSEANRMTGHDAKANEYVASTRGRWQRFTARG